MTSHPLNKTIAQLKKSGYKYQIEQELLQHDWEIVEIGSDKEWWDDEHWKIQLRYNPSRSIYLCFIVDPQFSPPRKKGQGIYEIMASTTFPTHWNDSEHEITSLNMTKGNFEVKLQEFIQQLEEFKRKPS